MMEFLSLLKTVSPWIATAITGPFGGMAVEAAANALGLSDKTVDSVKQALSGAMPEQMLALKQADQAFSLQMQALGFKQVTDLEGLAVADRADARKMQITSPSPVPALLSIGVTLGYFAILIGMMVGWFKVSDSQALLIMLGSLGTAWGSVMAFWFGTTRDSSRKTEMLAQSSPST